MVPNAKLFPLGNWGGKRGVGGYACLFLIGRKEMAAFKARSLGNYRVLRGGLGESFVTRLIYFRFTRSL